MQLVGLTIAILIISLGIHEAAHGWVALKCGDTTARDMGRITLDPFAHIDPFMTIILPILMFLTMGVPFGGAKPVPVVFSRLRHGHRDMALVALAGPVSNVLLAILFAAIFQLTCTGQDPLWGSQTLAYQVLNLATILNLLLAAFNMIPVPPLDGSRVMTFILPEGPIRRSYQELERFGLLIIIVLVMFPGSPIGNFIGPAIEFLLELIHPLVSWLAQP